MSQLRLMKTYPGVNPNISPFPLKFLLTPKNMTHLRVAQNGSKVYYCSRLPFYAIKQLPMRICADQVIPTSCSLYYFEVKVLKKNQSSFMGIGLAGITEDCNYFYNSNGFRANGMDFIQKYGPSFKENDIIGVGFNTVKEVCFFTKNGRYLGLAFEHMVQFLYPCVCLQGPGDEIEANFGEFKDFVYDLTGIRNSIIAYAMCQVENYKLIDNWRDKVGTMFFQYFLMNGYCETADAFAKAIGVSFTCTQDARSRQMIIELILKGDFDSAREQIRLQYPGLLEKELVLDAVIKSYTLVDMMTKCHDVVLAPRPFNRNKSKSDLLVKSNRREEHLTRSDKSYDVDDIIDEESAREVRNEIFSTQSLTRLLNSLTFKSSLETSPNLSGRWSDCSDDIPSTPEILGQAFSLAIRAAINQGSAKAIVIAIGETLDQNVMFEFENDDDQADGSGRVNDSRADEHSKAYAASRAGHSSRAGDSSRADDYSRAGSSSNIYDCTKYCTKYDASNITDGSVRDNGSIKAGSSIAADGSVKSDDSIKVDGSFKADDLVKNGRYNNGSCGINSTTPNQTRGVEGNMLQTLEESLYFNQRAHENQNNALDQARSRNQDPDECQAQAETSRAQTSEAQTSQAQSSQAQSSQAQRSQAQKSQAQKSQARIDAETKFFNETADRLAAVFENICYIESSPLDKGLLTVIYQASTLNKGVKLKPITAFEVVRSSLGGIFKENQESSSRDDLSQPSCSGMQQILEHGGCATVDEDSGSDDTSEDLSCGEYTVNEEHLIDDEVLSNYQFPNGEYHRSEECANEHVNEHVNEELCTNEETLISEHANKEQAIGERVNKEHESEESVNDERIQEERANEENANDKLQTHKECPINNEPQSNGDCPSNGESSTKESPANDQHSAIKRSPTNGECSRNIESSIKEEVQTNDECGKNEDYPKNENRSKNGESPKEEEIPKNEESPKNDDGSKNEEFPKNKEYAKNKTTPKNAECKEYPAYEEYSIKDQYSSDDDDIGITDDTIPWDFPSSDEADLDLEENPSRRYKILCQKYGKPQKPQEVLIQESPNILQIIDFARNLRAELEKLEVSPKVKEVIQARLDLTYSFLAQSPEFQQQMEKLNGLSERKFLCELIKRELLIFDKLPKCSHFKLVVAHADLCNRIGAHLGTSDYIPTKYYMEE